MKVEYRIVSIDSKNYITGWFACPNDSTNAVDLNPLLENATNWFDSNNNPIYKLNEDGSVEQVVIPLTQDQIILKEAQTSLNDNQLVVNDLIVQLLDYVVSGDSIPQDLSNLWITLRSTTQSAKSTISSKTSNL